MGTIPTGKLIDIELLDTYEDELDYVDYEEVDKVSNILHEYGIEDDK